MFLSPWPQEIPILFSVFRDLAILVGFGSFACFEILCGEDLTSVLGCKGFIYPFVKLILFPVSIHQLIILIIPVL